MFKFLRGLQNFLKNEIAIDLGTSSTLIYVKGKGIVLDEPSVVALDLYSNKVISSGNEAKKMLGKTPETVVAKRPMKDGVIADFEMVQEMIVYFLNKVLEKNLFVRPIVLIAVPSGITDVERRAVRDAALLAGVQKVHMVSEPVAAAVGLGLPIEEPVGNMLIDIGGGTTEIAVISLSGIVVNKSIRTAGDEMDEAIMTYIREKYRLAIGEQTAEEIKINLGNAFPTYPEEKMEVRGRDLVTGAPKTIEISSTEVRNALKGVLNEIIFAVKKALEQTPPELLSDIIDRGIYLTGGGSLLKGLKELLMEETNILIKTTENPRQCVVLGAGKILENIDKYHQILTASSKTMVKRTDFID
ncbi:MAG: rod shape-determining protein [candidate division WOR-3 bacterium]